MRSAFLRYAHSVTKAINLTRSKQSALSQRQNRHPATALLVLPFAIYLASAASGCGVSIGSYCEEARNCEGGNDLDEDACNISFDAESELADLKNCGAEFDAYFDCLAEQSRCNEDRYRPDQGNCQVEIQQFDDCAKEGN